MQGIEAYNEWLRVKLSLYLSVYEYSRIRVSEWGSVSVCVLRYGQKERRIIRVKKESSTKKKMIDNSAAKKLYDG